MRVCRLNFQLGKIWVKDQFLWDVADPDANPEAFAEVMCKDLKLPRKFVPEISCRIREQIIDHRANRKKGALVNHSSAQSGFHRSLFSLYLINQVHS